MSAPSAARSTAPDWEHLGYRITDALEGCASAVVLGDNPSAAALVALGLARAQARHRRVVVVDLVGDIPALQRYIPADVPHGLVDCVQYGVSLGKVTYPIDPAKNLFILPSGVGPIDHDALLRSDRWRALMRTFRQANTLVLLVVPAELPRIGQVVHGTDGVVAVGDVAVAEDWHVLGRVGEPAIEPASPPTRRTTSWHALALAAAVVVLAAGAWTWYARRSTATGPLVATIEHDSAFARDTIADTSIAAPLAPRPGMTIANPADSTTAAAYAVTLVTFNTAAAAEAQVDRSNSQGLPAVTISYVALGADSSRWYRVFVGAYRVRAAADSLLGMLRQRGLLAANAGRVVRAPLAVLVRDKVPFSDAHTIATAYRAKGIPVYALVQDDGSYTLYAGAFESPEQAALLLSTLRAAGEDPVVVYRTGRVL